MVTYSTTSLTEWHHLSTCVRQSLLWWQTSWTLSIVYYIWKDTSVFLKNGTFMQHHSLSADPWTGMETSISGSNLACWILSVFHKLYEVTCRTIFITTAVFWLPSLELLMLIRNHKSYDSHTYLCKRFLIFISSEYHMCDWDNSSKSSKSHFYLYHEGLREDPIKYVLY
jgi:hypothetical protein